MVDSTTRNPNRVGIEISRSGFRCVVLDVDDGIADQRVVSVVNEADSVQELIRLVEELKREFRFERVGVAMPGLVDRQTGKVAFSAHLPRHVDVDLVGEVKAATGMDVVVENDANAAAVGEYKLGAGRGSQNLFYATLGEGIGGAFLFEGEIWRGASGFAGEFGYVTLNSEGMRLEEVASAANIIRRTRSRFNRDSTSSLGRLEEEHIDLDAIINAAASGDDFAQLMLERTGTYVGTAIASVINLLNIDTIVVGGEIMQAKQVVIDAIVERAKELSFEPAFSSTTIVEGELGMNAAATGAAFLS